MSQIRVHVSRPEDPAVPNTGMLTQTTPTVTNGTGTDFYFGLGIIIAIIMVAILPAFFYRKWKKQGFSKKQLIPRILLVAIFSFGLSFGALYFAKTSTLSTLGATTEDELTATADDVDIYVELEDEPVFASVPSTIKVDKATEVGYILKAYAASADLVFSTDSTKKISGLVSSESSSMTENTWGISLTEADNQEIATWQALPTAQANAITIKDTTAQTAANDQTTIYYGVYVSPDTEPGTYIGTVSYIATPYLIMQEVNEWGDSIEVNQEIVAVDKRDGRKYTVARLKDGKLWMTQNLDLGRTNLAVDLTSENTNLETTVTADVFNSWRHDAGINSFEEGDVVIDDSIDSLSGKSHGMKYNYFAVSAGTISGPVNTGDAQYDICPAGWRLPTGGASGEFQALYTIEDYNSNEKMRAPVSEGGAAFTLSSENFGAYWSLNRVSNTGKSGDRTNMWSLRIDQTNVRPTHSHQRIYTISIRCIANPVIDDLTYMQDFYGMQPNSKKSVLASMAEEEQYYLRDARDDKLYRISKLKDGNVWMTQTLALNLADFIGTHYLTPANTDLISDSAKTRGYWDPSGSVQDRIDTLSDEFDARGLTHDFTGLSTLIIGQAQPQQYLSKEQTGYTWGSHIKDDGSFEAYAHNSNSNSNSYTEIPRSYSGENTISYNWYAATAESGTLAMTTGDAEDSICPAGWQLPFGTEENHSWYNLFINAYGLETNSEESATAIRNAPFYLLFEGGFNWNSGAQNTSGTDGYYHTTTTRANNVSFAVVHNMTTWIGTYGSGGKNGGAAVRCVTR